jgi:hypothetical protein
MKASELPGLQKEYTKSSFSSFPELSALVYRAEHESPACLVPTCYRDIAELDGYGINPEVEDLLKRAEAVREKRGRYFPDIEGTLSAFEQGRQPLTGSIVNYLALQAVCHHSVCANRVKNCPDAPEHQQALVRAADWRTRAERLLDMVLAKIHDNRCAEIAKLEQEVLAAEREGSVLSDEAYMDIASKIQTGRPEEVELLQRAEAVRERDGLFFRDLAGTIYELERGLREFSTEQLFALRLQADCVLNAVSISCVVPDLVQFKKSLYDRAIRLFTEGMARERARENERDHEGDLSSPHS